MKGKILYRKFSFKIREKCGEQIFIIIFHAAEAEQRKGDIFKLESAKFVGEDFSKGGIRDILGTSDALEDFLGEKHEDEVCSGEI